MNAFIGPKVRDYVSRLEDRLHEGGLKADLHVMASNGGVATAAMVAEKPVLTLLSGPAAGVLGGAWSGALSGRDRLITFDIGGTSADIGIVDKGRYAEATARDTWIGGYPVMVPMIDIHTIGAGGGSIAHVDAGGAFRVGPRSAGAAPGPAAYGRGGEKPTVTDANVVLGRLEPDYFLGGEMSLDVDAATRVIDALAAELKLDRLEAASGVLTIVNANMAAAIRSRTVQKGIDPRLFSLVAFGGAGPLHGAEVAELLGIGEVIVPPHPGITSAVGLLTTDLKYDAIRTAFQTSTAVDLDRLNAAFGAMQADIAAQLQRDGVAAERVGFTRAGDLRYAGQGYELRIGFPAADVTEADIAQVFALFHEQHRAEYGHAFPETPIEIVNIRLTGSGRMPKIERASAERGGTVAAAEVKRTRSVFRAGGVLRGYDAPVLRREALPTGVAFEGPAIVVQKDTTTIIPPGWTATEEPGGNLILRSKS
jgi:N-methylhydantoinase A/oxoprolinase/acetone carboxylase beta subunit